MEFAPVILVMLACFFMGWSSKDLYDSFKEDEETEKRYYYHCENCGTNMTFDEENDYFCPICGEMLEEIEENK